MRRNNSVQLECQFKAVTVERFTHFEWLKDDEPIGIHSSKYHYIVRPVCCTKHKMMTKLKLVMKMKGDTLVIVNTINYQL